MRKTLRIPHSVIYTLLGIAMLLSYSPAREVMKAQTAWLWVVKSTVTLNFVLLFFLCGWASDRLTKGMSRKRSWLIWAVALVVLVVALHFLGGMPTIFN